MNAVAGSPGATPLDEDAVKRGVASLRHPLTRALIVLTFTTGLVDAVSYLALGRVFTANMTGNVVLFGFGVAGAGGLPVVAPAVSLIAFLLGAGAGGVLVRRYAEHPALVSRALAIEVLLLAVAALVAGTATVHPGHASAYALIVLMAAAMGVRNTIVRHL
ncbi:MAG TPA: YoaK family protein, partial [Solirubrobacteraceae bacterium]|nr:YoaK family protein [Solirubrobacteraceae bacterium]